MAYRVVTTGTIYQVFSDDEWDKLPSGHGFQTIKDGFPTESEASQWARDQQNKADNPGKSGKPTGHHR
jgi:hypothetical protein